MGTVWRGEDEILGRRVAVKELRFPNGVEEDEKQRLITRTLREAKAIARIRSKSAITVFDVVDEDDRPWIVMELVEGRSLAEHIRQDGPLSSQRAAQVGLAVLDVLRAAHGEGILHRDVKPSNVLLEEGTDRVVLTDFGIAKVEGDPSVTSTGMLVGAPSYISPERARGKPPGPPADLWSLGGLLYAAVEGRPPYDKGSAISTLTAVMTEPVPKPERAEELSEVISGLLAKDPDERLDVDGARALLEPVASGEVQRRGTRRGGAFAGGSGAGAAGGAAGSGSGGGAEAAGAGAAAGRAAAARAGFQDRLRKRKRPADSRADAGSSAGGSAARTAGPAQSSSGRSGTSAAAGGAGGAAGAAERAEAGRGGAQAGAGAASRSEGAAAPAAPAGSKSAAGGSGSASSGAGGAGDAGGAGGRLGGALLARYSRRTLAGIVAAAAVLVLLVCVLVVRLADTGGSDGAGGAGAAGDGSGKSARKKDTSDGKESSGGGKQDKGKDKGGGSKKDGGEGGKKKPGGGSALPDGFRKVVNHDFHFSVAMPKGWKRTGVAGQNSGAKYSAPGGGLPKIQVDYTGSPRPDAAAAWRQQESAVRGSSSGYHRISLKSVSWRGYPTVADWQFGRKDDGQRVRVLNRGFKVDGSHGYAILITCKAGGWNDTECRKLRKTAFATFKPVD